MIPEAVKTLFVNAVHAINLDMPRVDFMSQRLDHAHVFVFIKPTAPRWKRQHLGSGMAEDQQFHIPVQSLTVPLVIFSVHTLGLVY
jgi:hypothetical protein